ncbi:hypothetical protein ABMA27_011368 [Loxostege sticticalis]|uniref:Ig-like domain-containing protein n=1 Tax=Loxostege sticticalis TaxID=481309 RepID=A0ABR3H2B4_LOXSC
MFSSIMFMLFSVIVFTFTPKSCIADMLLQQPSLNLYSPGELEFTDVLVKRVGDNLTLICELRGDTALNYYWNFVSANNSIMEKPYIIEQNITLGSKLVKYELTETDSGRYVCSAPPFSQAKYIHVQPYSTTTCAHGAFVCGARCVLPAYVCDGRRDCLRGDDEAPALCGVLPCARNDRLNCSNGRCIPAAACCRTPSPLCRQPACCSEHPPPPMHSGFLDLEMPATHDDRRAPDDYGFIQSTIYTVTACALIFMIAVVLLVSAICKMHMKRAALRSYARADRLTRDHHALAQRHRFPPCYSAQLLEHHSPLASPARDTQCAVSTGSASPTNSERRTRLSALTSVFTSRYRQVPTQCAEVEMTAVTSTAASSPSRVLEYRSPAGGLLSDGAPGLNAANEHPDRHRLTLQLGRFQLSIPRFGRNETRPDTPNVAEINIDDLDFVRLNSNETYTLNGRTIRLLGGNFENYPPLSHGSHPPPYNEAMRYKLYGPPPEYLSRDRLNRTNSVDDEARSNIEMPPCYDELSTGNNAGNSNVMCGNGIAMTEGRIVIDTDVAANNVIGILDVASGGAGICLIGESSGNNNVFDNVMGNSNGNAGVMSLSNSSNVIANNATQSPTEENATCIANSSGNLNNNNVTTNLSSELDLKLVNNESNNDNNTATHNGRYVGNGSQLSPERNCNNDTVETLKSVIDNLPAIDSDVNANDNVESVSC